MEKIILKDIVCKHNISIQTGYHSKVVHILVFLDEVTQEIYTWKTTTLGLDYEVGETYKLNVIGKTIYLMLNN